MSSVGQARRVGEVGSSAVLVATFAMPAASRYARHTHDEHQLAWAAGGVLTVVTDDGTWVLPSTRALWIPGGEEHETIADGSSTMRSVYLDPHHCSVGWMRPQPMAVGPLLAGLINHLAEVALDPERRARAEAVLVDLLEPVATATIDAPMPQDPRAYEVADALHENPADPRSLDEWGHAVGASARTLGRAFRADTGFGFDRWRTLARLQASLPELAAGVPVTSVARHVGYRTTSAFVAAFRRETGLTPGAYFGPPCSHLVVSRSAADR